jgi:hypothetical protein
MNPSISHTIVGLLIIRQPSHNLLLFRIDFYILHCKSKLKVNFPKQIAFEIYFLQYNIYFKYV